MLVELVANGGRLDSELAALRAEAAASDALARQAATELAEQLAAASTALQEAFSASALEARDELGGRLDGLLSELGKLGREQFRATTLIDGQGSVLEELEQSWREHLVQSERQSSALQAAQAELAERVRLALVLELLPVADALAASLQVAEQLLAPPPAAEPPPVRPWLARLRSGFRQSLAPESDRRHPDFEAWLDGLRLVEGRLLAVFERTGIRPIAAMGKPFDPHQHLAVAVEAASGSPDGTVLREELRGFTEGERVLRHAEVVVARATNGTARAPSSNEE
jgi:molecular chaperone GrpE (heat shock protein)